MAKDSGLRSQLRQAVASYIEQCSRPELIAAELAEAFTRQKQVLKTRFTQEQRSTELEVSKLLNAPQGLEQEELFHLLHKGSGQELIKTFDAFVKK